MQYNNFQFKGLLIDLNTATRFTSSFDQLKVLQRVFFVELDKKTAGSTNFIFKIDSTSFISTINLNTSLEMIIFYIV